MVKNRPSVVISRRNANIRLCTVIPLSGSEPSPMQPWHHKMTIEKLPDVMQRNDWWAKCDCIASVSFDRLDRFKVGKDPRTGKRIFKTYKVFGPDMTAIKTAIVHHLCMMDLITGKPQSIL